jgi:UDP-glucuronate 4-epimerase
LVPTQQTKTIRVVSSTSTRHRFNSLIAFVPKISISFLNDFIFHTSTQTKTLTICFAISNSQVTSNKATTMFPSIEKTLTNVPSDPSLTESDTGSVCSNSVSWATTEVVEPHVGYKKVLVTGGAGFIGSHVAEYLLERGDDVIIIDEVNDYYDTNIKESNLRLLRTKYPSTDRLKIYKGDICDAELMTMIFETDAPKWVCHMAARAGVRPSIQDPYVYIHSNIHGTTRLMEMSAKYGVQNFVFASSSSVYGGSKSTYFSEDEVVDNPVSPYAATKKACELLGYTYHHLTNLNVTGLRFFTVYGPRGRPDMAPFMFIDRVSRGLEIKQFGDGSSSRDYTYIDDIVDGVVRAVDRPYGYQIFNLGKGNGTSLKEFIDLVSKHTGNQAQVKVLPDQPGDVPYTCADVSRAEALLGYRSQVSFEEGIRRTVEWYQGAYEPNGQQHANNSSQLISQKERQTQRNETVSTVN